MPINSLPNELLSNIFLDATSEDLCDEIFFEEFPFPKYLTSEFRAFRSVCSRWNSVLVNDPRQWDVLLVYGVPFLNVFHLPTSRARARPLRIVIKTNRKQFESQSWMPCLASLLKPSLARCSGIYLEMDVEDMQCTLQEWSDTPAPLLKSICFRALSDRTDITSPLTLFAGHMPSLKRLMLSGVNLDWDACGIPFDRLELFRVESRKGGHAEPHSALDNVVAKAKSLQKLTMKWPTAPMSLPLPFVSESIRKITLSSAYMNVGRQLTGLEGSLPRLISLSIHGKITFEERIEPFLDFLEGMKCLHRFTFTASSEDFPTLDGLLALRHRKHGLKNLREMHVRLDLWIPEFAFVILQSFPLQSLHTLRITRSELNDQSWNSWMGDIEKVLPLSARMRHSSGPFGALRHLTFDILEPETLSFILQVSPHLESLQVTDMLYDEETEEEVLYYLTNMHATSAGPYCPNLTHVWFRMDEPWPEDDDEDDKRILSFDENHAAWLAKRAPFDVELRKARKLGAQRGLCKELEEWDEEDEDEEVDGSGWKAVWA
ncbi:hypothetical protein SISSUDRAFT_1044621 [Sistotremastrum suecicum HHB10207 ss-3]|uniref:Uncharacterized protein n=1 Tax=Sistotremastrum suecicum HHB10207 ss-3 TaxID=1314776 RepID=A0A166F1M7_9AGAM|nr:hypothetical protein SISSUDRAFT_1044621 [Sistotremastrum suecicum HHB10207 ss-3]